MKRLGEFKKRKGAEENSDQSLRDGAGFGGGGGGGLGGGGGGAGGGNTTASNSVQGGGGVASGGLAFEATKATSGVGDGQETKVRTTPRSALGEKIYNAG